MFYHVCKIIGLFLILMWPTCVFAFEILDDQDLNSVTAGGVDTLSDDYALNRIPFRYSSSKGEVDGEVIVIPTTEINNQSSLQLMDNAQSNLRSLVNVNAVNSPVQVLLNLNISINSSIGAVNQLNSLLAK